MTDSLAIKKYNIKNEMKYFFLLFVILLCFPQQAAGKETIMVSNPKFDLAKWQKGGLTSFSETCFAEYWDDLPPIVEKRETVDPYDFRHRMALGKYILEHSGDETVWGKSNFRHWYWGYLAQLDWQWRSGRLSDPTQSFQEGTRSDFIHLDSWWGYMNLGFTVAMFQAAAKAGLVPELKFSKSKMNLEKDEGFQQCVQHWEGFWNGPHKEYLAEMSNPEMKETAIDRLYKRLWPVHSHIISSSLPGAKRMEKLMPEEDLKAGLGWCHMVSLLDAMNWVLLSLEAVMEFGAGYLPTRRLDKESLAWLKEHRQEEYSTALSLFKLHEATPGTIEAMQGFWRRLTYFKSQRDNMPSILHTLVHGTGIEFVSTLVRVLALVISPHSKTEWAALIALIAVVAAGGIGHYYSLSPTWM
jgi:hypothetical protein